jgi:hypothetical protein
MWTFQGSGRVDVQRSEKLSPQCVPRCCSTTLITAPEQTQSSTMEERDSARNDESFSGRVAAPGLEPGHLSAQDPKSDGSRRLDNFGPHLGCCWRGGRSDTLTQWTFPRNVLRWNRRRRRISRRPRTGPTVMSHEPSPSQTASVTSTGCTDDTPFGCIGVHDRRYEMRAQARVARVQFIDVLGASQRHRSRASRESS